MDAANNAYQFTGPQVARSGEGASQYTPALGQDPRTVIAWVNLDTDRDTLGGAHNIWQWGLDLGGLSVPLEENVFVAILGDRAGIDGTANRHRFVLWDGTSWQFSEGTQFIDIRLKGLEIGSFNDGAREFDGIIDDFRIYGNTLLQEDLDELTQADTDGDGLLDFQDPDDDNDGLADEDEIQGGTNPKESDTDGDGSNDSDEILAGTDPLDALDFFAIRSIQIGTSNTVLVWSSASNQFYSVSSLSNLPSGILHTVDQNIPATPPNNVFTNMTPSSTESLNYVMRAGPEFCFSVMHISDIAVPSGLFAVAGFGQIVNLNDELLDLSKVSISSFSDDHHHRAAGSPP